MPRPLFLALLVAASPLTAAAQAWQPLFDGKTLSGWHTYRRPGDTAGWEVQGGSIVRTGSGGDLVTDRSFTDFELRFDWKVMKGGNSGVFYRLDEGAGRATFQSAPEYQVLDDLVHPDGKSRLTAAGANYGLYPSPERLVRPAGEWNEGRIVVRGAEVEHWLNGQLAVRYTLGSGDWEARVQGSKFAQWPEYGRAASGRIALQDHGDQVWYRNVRIREFSK